MTKLINKLKNSMNTSVFFSQTAKAPVDTVKHIDKINGMDLFTYPSTLYTLK